MASAVTVRWSIGTVDCELRMKGDRGELALRQQDVIIASATVTSAAAAYQWAADHVAGAEAPGKGGQRTGTG